MAYYKPLPIPFQKNNSTDQDHSYKGSRNGGLLLFLPQKAGNFLNRFPIKQNSLRSIAYKYGYSPMNESALNYEMDAHLF